MLWGKALVSIIVVLVMLAARPGDAACLERAGSSAAVRGTVDRANAEHPVGLRIASGEPIYLADRITSGPASGMQIMLLDQTSFTIGPDSSVTIDEFVYDPATNAGKLTASLGKGVFRFVTGKIAARNPADMTVKLPVATIGVRGTMVYGRSDATSAIVALAGAGPENNVGERTAGIDVTTPDGTVSIRRPGWGAVIARGKPPEVRRLSAATIDGIVDRVAPRPAEGAPPPAATAQSAAATPPPAMTGGAASNAAGQSSAAALIDLSLLHQVGGTADTVQASSIFAAQTGNGAGFVFGPITSWDSLQTIATGTGTFSQSGIALAGNATGSYTFSLTIDFGARSFSGSFSNINASGAFSVSNGNMPFTINYNGFAGQPAGVGVSTAFGGVNADAHVTFHDSGTIIAKFADQNLTLSQGANSATGGSVVARP